MVKSDKSANKKKICFVVTPIGKSDSDIRRHIDGLIKVAIKPAFGEEFEVKAAHDYVDSMSITKQVYEKLYESDLVIVNLTGLNPNVMYELGIRFCFGKPVILIAKEGEQLPFDITEYRTTFYKDDALGFIELKEKLENVKKTIKYSDKEKSPIHDALKQSELFKQLKGEEKSDNTTNEALSLILEKMETILSANQSKSFDENVNQNISNQTSNIKLEKTFLEEVRKIRQDAYIAKSLKEKKLIVPKIPILRELLKRYENNLNPVVVFELKHDLDEIEALLDK